MNRRVVTYLATLLVLPVPFSVADARERPPLFEDTSTLKITLTGPFNALARDDDADPVYRPAELLWIDDSGTAHRSALQIKPRGKSRRRDEVCQFPPLRLDFPKGAGTGTPFAGQNKLKLVTHCTRLGSSNESAVSRLWLEFLLYRVFNVVSDASLRVRPLEVTYVDSDNPKRGGTHGAFLIEDIKHLAKRIDAKVLETEKLDRDQLEPTQANTVEVFQYLAGNTDFSLTRGPAGESCCHNVDLLQAADGAVLAIPYDFDSTGVVDPPYAEPIPSLGIKRVRQRLYRGYCRPPEFVASTLDVFRRERPRIYAIFQESGQIHDRALKATVSYLDEFYQTIDDPKSLEKKILGKCI